MGGPRSKKEEWIFALHDEGHKTGSNWIYNNAREEYVTKADHDLDIIQQDPIFHTTGRPYWPKNECGAVPHHAPVGDAAVHSDAFWQILVHWGLDKPLLKIHGVLIKQKM